MADAVFQKQVQEAGLSDRIQVDSCGTANYHQGERADSRTLSVLRNQSVPYDGRARQILAEDLLEYDYILAMDRSNLRSIERLSSYAKSSAEIELFLSYAYAENLVDIDEVPDPYYDSRFEYVYELVDIGSQALLRHILHPI